MTNITDLTLPANQLRLVRELAAGKPLVLVLLENRPRIITEIAGHCQASRAKRPRPARIFRTATAGPGQQERDAQRRGSGRALTRTGPVREGAERLLLSALEVNRSVLAALKAALQLDS